MASSGQRANGPCAVSDHRGTGSDGADGRTDHDEDAQCRCHASGTRERARARDLGFALAPLGARRRRR